MNLLRKITDGVTDERIYRRIGWMYVSFFLLYVSVTVLSYYLLPEGIFRGKHPIISRLQFSPNVWVSTLQIFGYNLIPTALIIAGNLLAQQSRLVKERFVPIGYTAFWGLTILFAVITGSWSFDVVTAAPPLAYRLVRMFDILHHSGLLEFSAYLLAAVVSFKLTLWYSDRKKIIASRKWRDVNLTKSEKVFVILAFVLLFCGAYVESYGIIQFSSFALFTISAWSIAQFVVNLADIISCSGGRYAPADPYPRRASDTVYVPVPPCFQLAPVEVLRDRTAGTVAL